MSDITLLPCPHCGKQPAGPQMSENRKAKRTEAQTLFVEAKRRKGKPPNMAELAKKAAEAAWLMASDPEKAGKLLKEVELSHLGTRAGYEAAEAKAAYLDADVYEVRCSCNPHCFCWEDTAEAAAVLWNRACEKLDPDNESQRTPKECCKTSAKFTVDHDGEIIVKCKACHLRWMPLKEYKPGE